MKPNVRIKEVVVVLTGTCNDFEAEAEVVFNHIPDLDKLTPHIEKLQNLIEDLDDGTST